MDIKDALSKLDPSNPDHWTNAGLPSVSAVSELAGEPVTRAQIAEASPGFDREKAGDAGDNPPPADRDEGEQQNDAGAITDQGGAPELTPLDGALGSNEHGIGPDTDGDPNSDYQEPDALDMIEDVLRACNSDRFRHNYELQTFVRQWHVQQEAIRAVQARIDIRQAAKARRRA